MAKMTDLAAATIATATVAFGRVVVFAQTEVPGVPNDGAERLYREGGFLLVLLVVLYFYRRDFRQAAVSQQAQINGLLHVVQANITAMNTLQQTNAELARAVEANNQRRRVYDTSQPAHGHG
jgi:hypothetical protein